MRCEIKTERLLLRPLSVNDLNTAHEYSSDFNNTYFMMHLPKENIEETYNFLLCVTKEWEKENPAFYEFAIVLNNLHIGAISLYLDEERTYAEIGWILHRSYQKLGYATEAARALMDFAFNTLHIKKITAHCDYRNIPSYRVMEKIGLKLESDNGVRFYTKRNETAKELTFSITK